VPAMVLSLWGAARLSPGRASILMTFEVVVGIGSAAWLAGEDLGWQKILGGVLIVSASLLESWQARRETRSIAREGAAA
jgi:drug/metabolite transporter (DMT)-like permease